MLSVKTFINPVTLVPDIYSRVLECAQGAPQAFLCAPLLDAVQMEIYNVFSYLKTISKNDSLTGLSV